MPPDISLRSPEASDASPNLKTNGKSKQSSPAASSTVSDLSTELESEAGIVERRCAGCDSVVFARVLHASVALYCRECEADNGPPARDPDFLSDPEFVSALSLSDALNDSSNASSDAEYSSDESEAERSGSETYLDDLGGPVVRDTSGWGQCLPHAAVQRTYASDSEEDNVDDWTHAADAALDEEISDEEFGEHASKEWNPRKEDDMLDIEPVSQNWTRGTDIALDDEPVSQKWAVHSHDSLTDDKTSRNWARDADEALDAELESDARIALHAKPLSRHAAHSNGTKRASQMWPAVADISFDETESSQDCARHVDDVLDELDLDTDDVTECSGLQKAFAEAAAMESQLNISTSNSSDANDHDILTLSSSSRTSSVRALSSPRRTRSPSPVRLPPEPPSFPPSLETPLRSSRAREASADVKLAEKQSHTAERREKLVRRLHAVRTELEVVQMATAARSASAQTVAAARTGDEGKGKLRAEVAGLAATVDFLARLALEGAVKMVRREEEGCEHACQCR